MYKIQKYLVYLWNTKVPIVIHWAFWYSTKYWEYPLNTYSCFLNLVFLITSYNKGLGSCKKYHLKYFTTFGGISHHFWYISHCLLEACRPKQINGYNVHSSPTWSKPTKKWNDLWWALSHLPKACKPQKKIKWSRNRKGVQHLVKHCSIHTWSSNS